MRYDPNRGYLFDAICACILSEKGVSTGFTEEIPAITVPFFMERENMDAPILAFFKERIHSNASEKGPVDGWTALTEALGEDEGRDRLRELVYEALFFPDIPPLDGSVCSMKTAALLDGTAFSTEFKYRALLCLTYFRHAAAELCRILQTAVEWTYVLHKTAETETDALFSAMRAGKYNSLYQTSANLDLSGFSEITVSISFLQPELILPVVHDKSLLLIVGKDHPQALLRAMDESAVDIGIFLDDIGNELRRMILESLSEEDSMTASDISRRSGIPVTTVLRHMEALTDHYLIRVSGRRGQQIFYTLNREYIAKARIKTDKYLFTLGGDRIEERNERNEK